MEKLSGNKIRTLLNSMDYINGQKTFGEYDLFVGSYTDTQIFEITTNASPDISIVIPTMERPEKTLSTIESIATSAGSGKLAVEIIIIDNSFTPYLRELIQDRIKASYRSFTGLVRIVYHYDSRLTFPMARNVGFSLAANSSRYLGSWDSDIHCDVNTLSSVLSTWNLHSDYIGIAPTLITYSGNPEDIDPVKQEYKDLNTSSEVRAKTQMPGVLGDKIGRKEDDILQTTMMRGAYFIKKDALSQISNSQPDNDIFPRDFIVWSNVPVFMTANELRRKFGYSINPKSLALHKDEQDGISMGLDMPHRISENLKSLLMLFYRNRVFPESDMEQKHHRLLEYNLAAIMRVLGVNFEIAHSVIIDLQHFAHILDKSNSPEEFISLILERKLHSGDIILPNLQDLLKRITHPDVFRRIKLLHAYDPEVKSYYIPEA